MDDCAYEQHVDYRFDEVCFNMAMETEEMYVDYWQRWKGMGDLERKRCVL